MKHLVKDLCIDERGIFTGEVVGAAEYFKEELKGKFAYITIQPYYNPRTTGDNSQNNKIWGVARRIAEHIGDDERSIVLEACKRAITRGYRQATKNNEPVYDLNGEPIPISIRDADVKEASLVIDELEKIASFLELGI